MSFRKLCHMPFRKLIPPFTLTEFGVGNVLVSQNLHGCDRQKGTDQ